MPIPYPVRHCLLIPFSVLLVATCVAQAVPVNVALNQPAMADSQFSPAYPASNAVDGNSVDDASRWLSADTAPPHWIEVDLGQTYSLSQMKFWTGKVGVGTLPLDDFALQYWNGTGWTDLYSETASTNTGTVDVGFGPTVSGNRVRLHVTATDPANGDGIVRLFELEIYGEAYSPTNLSQSPASGGTLFDPASDIVVTFDAPVLAGATGGVRIENLETSTDLAGISASVSGSDLIISHGGLATSGNYAVHIPDGAVLLASDGTTPSGAIYWEFETAPLKPQLTSYTNEISNLTDPIELTFDRDINLLNASSVDVVRFADGTTPGTLGISATGDTLSITHDPLLLEEVYIVTVAAGAAEGIINGETNDALSLLVYGGSTVLFETDFDTGLEGFNTAFLLGETTGTSSNIYWKWTNSGTGPDFDSEYLRSDTNYTDDFVVSPQVDLIAGRSYVLNFRAHLWRNLHVGLTPTASLADVEEIALVSSGGPKSVRLEFTATTGGPQYLIFFSGETNPWGNQAIDALRLTEAIPPAVRINTPSEGSSHLESASIPVEIEAFGIAGDLVSVEIFDNEVSRGTLTGSLGIYTYNWDYHAPGAHTLRVEATDDRGNVSSAEVNVTVTFDDGALPPFIGWDFDAGSQGWEFTTGVSWYVDRVRVAAAGQLSFSSPEIFLFAGETYTVQFKARTWGTANTFNWAFLATADPGFPADDTGRSDFHINSGTYEVFEIPFTVSADGPYRLTFFETNSSYNKVEFDDIRLIGNFNTAPLVDLTSPASAITTIADSDVTLTANPSDLDGTVVAVEFRDTNTGQLVAPDATVNSAPWSYTWSNVSEGEYSVFARAIDDASGVGDSVSRTITVAPNQYSISTYLGSAATDEAFTGAAYLSDGTLVMSGILDPGLFPGALTPVYLNGATPGDRGVVVRLSEDGQTVLSVTVVGTRVLDIDTDGSDRIFVAAGDDGAIVLNAAADTVLWSNDFGAPHVHRIDAADGGTFALITSSTFDYLDERISSGTNYVYNSSYVQLGSMGGGGAFTTDVAVDEATQTVVFIGWKNITDMEGPAGDPTINPVDIPGMVGRAYDGTLKWRGYDWEKEASGDRFLNLITNNMADTRGSRVIISPDGKLYAGIEFDGGNTPLRYDPFDITVPVSVVGGDSYHSMSNTSTVPKTFVGRYDPGTGTYETGQWITNRLNSGNDNTIRIKNGNLIVDSAGRVHVVGGSASGLPLSHDPLTGVPNTGGAYHLVYSPDFTSREFVTRLTLSTSSGLSNYAGIALSPNGMVATAGRSLSPFLFDVNAWQSTLNTAYDAHFAVVHPDPYYKFQTGTHPRLFFDAAGLQVIRDRLGDEPYASMLAELIAQRDFGDFYRPYTPGDGKDLLQRAQASAFIYALTGTESYAADAKADIETAWGLIGSAWTSTGTKGLDLYWYATKLATAYDLCVDSVSWDAAFDYQTSKKLLDIALVIEADGGTEQPSDLGSNWAAARGSSAGLALLATDHAYDAAVLASSHNRALNYLNTNQGPGATRGWNPEGFGYTAFAIGSYLGPYAVAAERNGVGDLTTHAGLQWMPWTGFAGATTAIDVYGFGGVKTDWSNDNGHVGGEGTYGLAFAFAPDSLKPGLVHAYDRFQGVLSPNGAKWGAMRAGTFWSILYYPADIPSQNPLEIWDWHQGSNDSAGLGIFTFRDGYAGADDILVQFNARLRALTQANNGPDGLGFRIIGLGDPFAVGGGRNGAEGELSQTTVYPSSPDANVATNNNTGSLVGTPLVKPDGGGHAIAAMALNNVGTTAHKRWLVTDYDLAETGADAVIIVADTTTNGMYWQLPTFLGNTVTSSGNTFTITGFNGATLKGTILHPGGTPAITIGTEARGSSYAVEDTIAGDYDGNLAQNDADAVTYPRVEDNRYLFIQGSGDGDFLVVMTMMKTGSHPAVSQTGGSVADAVVQVGNKNYALQWNDVLYSSGAATPAAYTPPDATVTFDAGANGSITSGTAVQTVAYGAAASEPGVTPNAGYTFAGWDKAFDPVVQSMTVTALYEAASGPSFGSFIEDPAYGLAPADQDPSDNPDFDRFVNLIEYALVLNPAIADGFDVVSAREESGNLILSYRVRDGATDITVTPRYSDSLQPANWTDIPGGNIAVTGSGPGYTEYEASMPIGANPVFLLLEVTQN